MSESKNVKIDYKLVPIQNVSLKLREKCYQLLKYTFREHFKEKLVLTVLKPFKLFLEFVSKCLLTKKLSTLPNLFYFDNFLLNTFQ